MSNAHADETVQIGLMRGTRETNKVVHRGAQRKFIPITS